MIPKEITGKMGRSSIRAFQVERKVYEGRHRNRKEWHNEKKNLYVNKVCTSTIWASIAGPSYEKALKDRPNNIVMLRRFYRA